jgi:hypothetical protein
MRAYRLVVTAAIATAYRRACAIPFDGYNLKLELVFVVIIRIYEIILQVITNINIPRLLYFPFRCLIQMDL